MMGDGHRASLGSLLVFVISSAIFEISTAHQVGL